MIYFLILQKSIFFEIFDFCREMFHCNFLGVLDFSDMKFITFYKVLLTFLRFTISGGDAPDVTSDKMKKEKEPTKFTEEECHEMVDKKQNAEENKENEGEGGDPENAEGSSNNS